jgi:hypothetical protein
VFGFFARSRFVFVPQAHRPFDSAQGRLFSRRDRCTVSPQGWDTSSSAVRTLTLSNRTSLTPGSQAHRPLPRREGAWAGRMARVFHPTEGSVGVSPKMWVRTSSPSLSLPTSCGRGRRLHSANRHSVLLLTTIVFWDAFERGFESGGRVDDWLTR